MRPVEKSPIAFLMSLLGAAFAAALAAAPWPDVLAQQTALPEAPSTHLLDGDQLTEENLIKALAPKPGTSRTRSLRLHAEQPSKAPDLNADLLITFVTGSSDLTPQARDKLDILARALKSDSLKTLGFVVEGHADPRGTVEGNRALSLARARSVREYLAQTRGIDESRLTPIGKGSSELANTENPIAPENRRVRIITDLK